MDINKFLQSKMFKGIIFGIAAIAILLLVFKIGVVVGAHKANFSCQWSDNYHRNFGGPQAGFLRGFEDFRDKNFIEANGTFGQIIKIDNSTIVVKGRNDIEKIILVKDTTTVKRLQETIKINDLKIDDHVVIIGEPNNTGQIEAKLIRLMPVEPRTIPSNKIR